MQLDTIDTEAMILIAFANKLAVWQKTYSAVEGRRVASPLAVEVEGGMGAGRRGVAEEFVDVRVDLVTDLSEEFRGALGHRRGDLATRGGFWARWIGGEGNLFPSRGDGSVGEVRMRVSITNFRIGETSMNNQRVLWNREPIIKHKHK